MAIDPMELRRCLGHFATGVTVVSTRDDAGEPYGATVNAFTAVSLDPPLVLVSLDRRARTCSLLHGRPFTVNVLEAAQKEVALHFAGRRHPHAVTWDPGDDPGSPPALAGALAHVVCTSWQAYDGGDHVLHLGEVQSFRMHGGQPLLFHTGRFHHLGTDHELVLWDESGDGPAAMSWFSAPGGHDRAHQP